MKKNKKMKFVIRDDDLNFFSMPEHIRVAYTEVFDQNIPVSFSTIPVIALPNDAWLPRPLPVESEAGEFPIHKNISLVEYVRNNPLIEIMQHGYTHQTPNGVFEYAQKTSLFEQTMKGKKELENTFGKPVNVFVAPHDQFSTHGIFAIEHAGLNIIRGKGVKNFVPKSQWPIVFIKMIFHRLKFFGKSLNEMPAYPFTLNLGKHQEAFGIRIECGKEALFSALAFAYKTGGNFILVNHIHDFDETKKSLMLDLIDEAKKYEADFVFATDLFVKK